MVARARAVLRVPVLRRLRHPVPARSSSRGETRIGWRASYQITMAGVAATRLFAAAGAGGIALTAWALRRSGMARRRGRRPDVAFLVLLYVRLHGRDARRRPRPVHRALPRAGAVRAHGRARRSSPLIVDRDLPGHRAAARRRRAADRSSGPRARGAARASWRRRSTRPGLGGRRRAHRDRTSCATRDRGVLGAVAWWGFDIAMLWACFHAFGEPPPFAVHRDGVLRRACSATCCRCRAASAASTAA